VERLIDRYAIQKRNSESCGSKYVLVRRDRDGTREVLMVRARCKTWLCPRCSKKRARFYAERVFAGFEQSKVSLLTLTMDHRPGFDAAWDSIKPAWNRFRTAFTARFGRLRYVCVLEPQPGSGFPHLHVLVDRYLPWEWLNAECERAGFGRIKDITYVRGYAAYGYVLKYLRKPWSNDAGTQAAVLRRMRRFTSSKGFDLAKTPSTWDSRFCKLLSEDEALDLAREFAREGGEFHVLFDEEIRSAQGYVMVAASPPAAVSREAMAAGKPWRDTSVGFAFSTL